MRTEEPKVLLIEDDPNHQTLVQRHLVRANLSNVECVDRLEAGLERLMRGGIDAVLLDLRLPDSAGIATLSRALAQAGSSAIVVLSSLSDENLATEAVQQGAQDYLVKSQLTGELLSRAIRYAIERKRHALELEQQVKQRTLDLVQANQRMLDEIVEREQAERNFRELLESAPDAMVIVSQSGTIALVNAQTERMFGMGRDRLLGQPVECLMPPRYHHRHAEHRDRFFDHPSVRPMGAALELFGLRSDGCEFPVEISLSPIQTEAGLLVSAAIRDVTHRKQMQQALAETNVQLLQSARLAAIGQMVTGLAHESRNALQRIQACLSMLQHRIDDQEKVLDLTNRIQQAHDDLHYLYEQVRQYAAPIQLDLGTCQLDRLVEEAWEKLSVVRHGRQAVLRQNSRQINLRCVADQFGIEQVFRNILENSLAACADPVQIEVSWSERKLDRRSAVCVAFRDNGPGFSAEQRAKLLEPFYTTKIRGTGLGMAIAKRLIEAHGGKIEIGSTVKPGAEIVITLLRRPGDTK